MTTGEHHHRTTARAAATAATIALGLAGLSAPAAADRPGPPEPADGSLGMIAYDAHSRATRDREVFTIRTDGSERHRVTSHGGMDPSWSPDGTRIAYTDEQGVWVVDADGGGDHLLAAATDGSLVEPAWSPDGTEIAVSGVDDALLVVDTGTGAERTLLTPTRRWGAAYDASWSPDGSALVVTRTRRTFDFFAVSQLFTVDVATGVVTALPSTAPAASSPDWSPDGTRIFYSQVSLRGDTHWSADVWAVAPDGTGNTLVSAAGGVATDVSVAPDGQRLALADSDEDPLPPDLTDLDGVWTMRADGTGRQLVVRGGSDPDWRPAYTGDPNPSTVTTPGPGARLVAVAASAAGTDLVSLEPDGTGLTVLTHTGQAWDPAWSPDHERIAYLDGDVLRVVRSDGSGDHAVRARVRPNGHLAWSPDGRRIAWGTDDAVVVLGLRTGHVEARRLPDVGDLAWSPDGRAIAVGEVRGGTDPGLRLVRPGRSGVAVVSHARGVETRPSWSADGALLAWTITDRAGRTRIDVMAVDEQLTGHDRRTVWETPGLDTAPAWEPDGGRLALFSDGPAPGGPAPAPGVWVTTPAVGTDPGLALLDRSVSDLDW